MSKHRNSEVDKNRVDLDYIDFEPGLALAELGISGLDEESRVRKRRVRGEDNILVNAYGMDPVLEAELETVTKPENLREINLSTVNRTAAEMSLSTDLEQVFEVRAYSPKRNFAFRRGSRRWIISSEVPIIMFSYSNVKRAKQGHIYLRDQNNFPVEAFMNESGMLQLDENGREIKTSCIYFPRQFVLRGIEKTFQMGGYGTQLEVKY